MIPEWFTVLSVSMLVLGGLCALTIAGDLLAGHQQHMWIMNVVWPVSALFGTVFVLRAYFKYGRLASHHRMMEARQQDMETPNKTQTPFPMMVAKGTLHCGSGCTLGDICAEFLALYFPVVATWVGWRTIFPDTEYGKVFAVWVIDYIFAFLIGIAFQYFTIKPMRNLSPAQGVKEAIKADILSLTAWQIGMYGFMAIAQFVIFVYVWDEPIKPNMPEFWFMMQIAMICGFITAYPINWWLVKRGIKERM